MELGVKERKKIPSVAVTTSSFSLVDQKSFQESDIQ